MRTNIAAAVAATALLATGCTERIDSVDSEPIRGVDIERERAALVSIDRELSVALESANRDQLASFYAPDASVHAPGMKVITGRDAIRRLLEDPLSAEGTGFEIATDKVQVAAAGDIAYTTGTFRLSRADGRAETGKYVTIWKKQDDGGWRIIEDIFNGDEPVAPATTTP